MSLDGGNSQVQVSGSIALDSSYSVGGNLRIYDFGILDVISGISLDFDTLNAAQSIIFGVFSKFLHIFRVAAICNTNIMVTDYVDRIAISFLLHRKSHNCLCQLLCTFVFILCIGWI